MYTYAYIYIYIYKFNIYNPTCRYKSFARMGTECCPLAAELGGLPSPRLRNRYAACELVVNALLHPYKFF